MAELKIVLPGDQVALCTPGVGPGLHVTEDDPSYATVCAPGLLRGAELEPGSKKKVWIDYNSKRVSLKEIQITFYAKPYCISF